MQELLEIRLLGPFEVLAGGTPADVGGSKRQALCWRCSRSGSGRVVDVDALVDGLWGEELPAAPRNALHHHIARLRAALGEESIVGFTDGYALQGRRASMPSGSRSCSRRRAPRCATATSLPRPTRWRRRSTSGADRRCRV